MKLFAALERALLARWRKIKVALKVNKWPLLSLKEQRLQLKKQYLESLFRKKWQKFVKPIYVCGRSHFPHWQQYYTRLFSLIESSDSLETHRNKVVVLLGLAVRLVKCGLPFTLMCNMVAIWDCYNVLPSVGVPVSRQYQAVSDWDSQSYATQMRCLGLLKS